ncbi:MAG: hypoxanthine phosphoribosyltransferase [Phycisphaerales bacterium]|nr:hypoxanthine phosphoribosyltransferase [Phycisphaerales bacterium]
MEGDIERVLISEQQLAQRVDEMARDIAACYPEMDPGLVMVPILSGSIIFLADLIRLLPMKMKLGMITVSSYSGAVTESQGASLKMDLNIDIRGQHVLIIDDILDTGGTLRLVRERLRLHEPKSIRTAVLLRKPSKAPKDVVADFVGFEIADEFVVGYGLDYDGHYRNYPNIAVLKADRYTTG